MGRPRKTEIVLEDMEDSIMDETEELIEEDKNKPSSSEKDKEIVIEENNETTSSDDEVVDSLQNSLNKFLIGEKIRPENDEDLVCIPTGLDILDTILGGGFYTKFNGLIGPAGGGKSALSASVIKAGQKKYGKDFISIYLDSEEAMTKERLQQLGVKNDISIITGITIEKVFKTIELLCVFKEQNPASRNIPSLIIWDSLSNTKSEKEMTSDELVNTMGATRALLLSYYLPKYIQKLSEYKICVIAINQYRTEINMGANPYSKPQKSLKFMKQGKTFSGGQSVYYNSFALLDISQGKVLTDANKIPILGFDALETSIFAIKNKAFAPNVPINLVFNFHKGFLNFWSNFNMLKEQKYIKSGAWCKLSSYPTVQFRQKDALKTYKENSEFKAAFDKDVQNCLKNTYIDSHKNDEEIDF